MAIPLQKSQGKVKQIKGEGEWEKEEEVIIHYEIGSPRWKSGIMTISRGTGKTIIPSRKGK